MARLLRDARCFEVGQDALEWEAQLVREFSDVAAEHSSFHSGIFDGIVFSFGHGGWYVTSIGDFDHRDVASALIDFLEKMHGDEDCSSSSSG